MSIYSFQDYATAKRNLELLDEALSRLEFFLSDVRSPLKREFLSSMLESALLEQQMFYNLKREYYLRIIESRGKQDGH